MMNLFRNFSSQNQDNRGKSVGGKVFSLIGLRNMEPKFFNQLNSTLYSTKNDDYKIDVKKSTVHKQNIPPQTIAISNKASTKLKYCKIRGLHNIGNTCYLNSTLQCLLHLPKFIQGFYDGSYCKDSTANYPVSKNFAQIIKQLIIENSITPLNPSSFKLSVGKKVPRFLGNSQQDSQQFLTATLQCINQQLSRIKIKPSYKELDGDPSKKSIKSISQQWWEYYLKRDNSIISDHFTGQILSTVTCKKCSTKSVTFDNVWGLPVSIVRGSKTIPQLIFNHLKSQNNIEDYSCSHCKKFRNCTRQLQFFRLPEVLVIQLKRFEFDKYSKDKITHSINVQIDIDIKPFVNKQASHQETRYKLVGMVHHFGDTDFGHYTATVFDHQKSKWYQMNDSRTEQVKHIEGSSKSVYLLFYQKK